MKSPKHKLKIAPTIFSFLRVNYQKTQMITVENEPSTLPSPQRLFGDLTRVEGYLPKFSKKVRKICTVVRVNTV